MSAALVVLVLVAGCTGGETDHTDRDAAIYRSVIVDLVDRSGADIDDGPDLPVLFIEALGPAGIPLGVQVEVVGGFVEQYEIRFIDDFEEAVEVELPDLPVREGSLLIGLGDVDVDVMAEVHSEVYFHRGEVMGFSFTLVNLGDLRWDVVGSPAEVEAEGLMPTS